MVKFHQTITKTHVPRAKVNGTIKSFTRLHMAFIVGAHFTCMLW